MCRTVLQGLLMLIKVKAGLEPLSSRCLYMLCMHCSAVTAAVMLF